MFAWCRFVRKTIMILARGRNMFSLSESYAVYGFFIGMKFKKNITSKLRWKCKYQIWSIVNLLAIIAERAIKKESDGLPDGISHHTAQLLAIMADAVLRNNEVRSEILMFDQSQEEVNEKAAVKMDWSFVQERHGVIFSSRAMSFVSALARYGEDDAAVFEKTVRIFKDELCKGIELEWGDEEDASDVLMNAKLHKLRDRYLRTLDRFVRQMEDYAASLGAGEVVKEWIEVGQELGKLRGIRVILKFDWEIQHQAHKVCHLINCAMSDTLTVHLMAVNNEMLLPAPPRSPSLPAPAGECPTPSPPRKYHRAKTDEWSKKAAAEMAGVGVRQLTNWDKKPPDPDYPGWEDPLSFTKWINNRKDKALMAIKLKNSVSYKETVTEKSMKKR